LPKKLRPDQTSTVGRKTATCLDVDDKRGIEYGALVEGVAAVDTQSYTDLVDVRSQLVDGVPRLGDRERLVATFYFYEGLTLKKIGKALELSEGRISQILRHASTKLRKHLKGSPLEHDDVGGWRTLNQGPALWVGLEA
jgi:DNA-directed RNA polymerase sigma subunit (sigma70/sigma32)